MLSKATFSGGCFWCLEAVFKRLKGVESVQSGYAGAGAAAPTYEQVSSGSSGFAEAVEVEYDPDAVSYETLLDVFWAIHDPTTLNRQGNDAGPQYRAVIFYADENQRLAAEKSKADLIQSAKYTVPIVTAIEPLKNFFPAEDYHREYYERNRNQGYCRLVIDPKIQKLYKDFADKVA